MSLGDFEIYLPLGLEHLQMIASKEDLVQQLPEYRFDEGSEFYLVEQKARRWLGQNPIG